MPQVPLQVFMLGNVSLFSQSCLLKGKYLFELLARLQTRDVNGRSPNPFTTIFLPGRKKKEQEIFRSRRWACIFHVKWCTVGCIIQWHEVASKPNSLGDVSCGKEIAPLLQWICWLKKSGLIFFLYFYICYHAGGCSKHLPRPEVKRRKEESSPKDALTRKKGETHFAGKIRIYLWACPLTPTPQPHLSSPSPTFLPPAPPFFPQPYLSSPSEINMRGSRKMAWIVAVRTTQARSS